MKLANFVVHDQTLQVAGMSFDLHDELQLLHQAYDLGARRLVSTFSGSHVPADPDLPQSNVVEAELVLTFEEVSFLRMQMEPIAEDTNACLVAFEPAVDCISEAAGTDVCPLGTEPGVDCISRDATSEMVIVYGELFASNERPDWTGYYVLSFIHGPEILINAAEAHATFSQKNRV